jgi:hypothetical protein
MSRLRFGCGAAAAVAAATVLAAGLAAASGWTVVPVPPAGQPAALAGVSADSSTDAWAVGWTGGGFRTSALADHWNGRSWQQAAIGTREALTAVSAASPTDAWAVGRVLFYGNSSVAYHWDGSTWTQTATSLFHAGQGVADIGPGNAWAVGMHLQHWNGTTWTAQAFPDPANPGQTTTWGALGAISAHGASDIWVTGAYNTSTTCATTCEQTFALHWNGTSWSLVPMPPVNRSTDPSLDYALTSAEAISPPDVWAAGFTYDSTSPGSPLSTLVEHWDRTRWSVVPAPSPGTASALTGITASSAGSVWAVGYDTPTGAPGPQTLTLFWNGTSWATGPSPHPGSSSTLGAVSAAPGTATTWAVGSNIPAGASQSAPLALRNG